MWGWIHKAPRYCLKIGSQDLAWAEVSRNWRGRRRYRSAVTGLSDGIIRLSPLEPNVLNPGEFQERIRVLAGTAQVTKWTRRVFVPGMPRAVTLILPDLAVRLAVLHLQELPPTYQEREAVIRWRLGQEQLLSLTGAKVFFQVVSTSVLSGERRNTILTVVVQESVLEQYEAICEEAGLLPQQVEVASLALFNMWVRTAGGLNRIKSDFLWVNIADGGFTAFIFHQRELVFIRTKPQGIGVHDEENAEGPQSPWVEKVIEECAASLYACQQHHPGLAVKNMILIGDGERHVGFRDKLERDLGLSVKELGWEDVRHSGAEFAETSSIAALQAVAGVA
ncbi:MAG: hypothetical protein ABW047_13290 [Nitrospiraceae bacterium]